MNGNARTRACGVYSHEISRQVAARQERDKNCRANLCDKSTRHAGRKIMADVRLDTSGLNCPLPILKARKAIKQVPVGGTLEVIATDPGAVEDFETFCRVSGHELLRSEEGDGAFRFLIRHRG